MERELIVIGGGPGGYTAAIRASQLGARVTVIEEGRLGGTCLNRGCIPTKALYKNAHFINECKEAESLGLRSKMEELELDFARMQERKQGIINQLVEGIEKLFKANAIELINGKAKLIDRNTVEISLKDGNRQEIKGQKILIAGGSLPSLPSIPGRDLLGVMTSEEILNIEKIPKSMVIVGGGVIGIELAGIFQVLGTEVTIMEYLPAILPNIDTEVTKRLAMSLKRRGLQVETGVQVKGIAFSNNGLKVIAESKKGKLEKEAEIVLIATGRVVNVAGLNLENVGINYDRKGIKVDASYETNIPGVYAIGDVIGGQMLAHVAAEEGIAVVEMMLGHQASVNYQANPACVFTFPEIATVGLTEDQIKREGIPYLTSKFMFGANGKALTMNEGEGFVKVICHKENKKILGVHIMGPHASDLIHEGALAIANEMTVEAITKTIHAHPTLSEAFLEAVLGLENRSVHLVPRR
ncbi:MAG: dihydrolipoyl dehydrogenase [Dehalobacterium sp.]